MTFQLPATIEVRTENGVPQCRIVSDGQWHDIASQPSATTEFAIPVAGALPRPLIGRFNEGRVSVFDFMTAAQITDYQSLAGALDHTAAAQAALDTGEPIVELPSGLLSLQGTDGLTMTTSGQHLRGAGFLHSYLNTPATGAGIDLLRVAASRCRVSNVLFRPGRGADRPLVLYSGECEIDHNRFLSGVPGAGSMISLTDQDPLGTFVSGAYSHWVHHNICGASGYNPLFFVETDGTTGGQNDNRYENNRVWADRPFFLHAGGGIVIRGNKLQSATGTQAQKAGVAIDCENAIGVSISQNYVEKYSIGVNIRAGASDIRDDGTNHWDNVTSQTVSASGAPKLKRPTYVDV